MNNYYYKPVKNQRNATIHVYKFWLAPIMRLRQIVEGLIMAIDPIEGLITQEKVKDWNRKYRFFINRR